MCRTSATLVPFVLAAACAGEAPPPLAAPAPIEAGMVVWQSHAPQRPDDRPLVRLDLELWSGDTVLSQPSVVTFAGRDATVRQSFTLARAAGPVEGSLELTVRPADLQGDRCHVAIASVLSGSPGAPGERHDEVVRTSTGAWADVLPARPIGVRLRCSAVGEAPTRVSRR